MSQRHREKDGTLEPRIACKQCGSRRLRRSRPRTKLELLIRILVAVHFHTCRDCGKRGWHLGAMTVPLRGSGRRRHRHRLRSGPPLGFRLRVWLGAFIVAACVLGLLLALGLHSCDSKSAPPSSMEQLD